MKRIPFWLPGLLMWALSAPFLLFPATLPWATAGAMVLLLLPRSLTWRATGHLFPNDPLAPFVTIYLLLALLAFWISPLPLESLPKLTGLYLGANAYFLALDVLHSRPDPQRAITTLAGLLALAGGAIALLAPFVVAWPERQVIDVRAVIDNIPHLTGDFSIHANEVAGVLLFLLPFAIFLAVGGPAGHGARALGMLLVLVMLAMLGLMQSRAAFLALVVMIIAVPAWSRFPLRSLALAVFTAVCLLLLVLFVLDVTPAQLSQWALELDTVSKQGALAPRSWPMRAEIWGAAWQMLWVDYPAFGAGLNTFVPISQVNYPFEFVPPYLNVAHAHNLWLQAGADFGWPGAILITLLLLVPLGCLWNANVQRHEPAGHLIRVYGISLLGYSVFNLFDVVSPAQRPGTLVWLLLAGVSVLVNRWRPLPNWVAALAALPLVALFVLSVSPAGERNRTNLWWDTQRLNGTMAQAMWDDAELVSSRRRGVAAYLRGDWETAVSFFRQDREGATFLQGQGRRADEAGRYAEAMDWYNMALELAPTRATIYFWRGNTYEKLEEPELALADYEVAAQLAPQNKLSNAWRASILFNIARLQAEKAQWSLAARFLREAISLDDTQPIFHELLGDMLHHLGDEEGAAAAYERASKMSGD